MRLRPSGQKGPVATQLSSFIDYQAEEAWTWEHMALTRARVIVGPAATCGQASRRRSATCWCGRATGPRSPPTCATCARASRRRRAPTDIWDLKQVRGGLVDLEFIAQHLQLVHAGGQPGRARSEHVRRLREAGCCRAAARRAAEMLMPAARSAEQSDADPAAVPRRPVRSGHGAGRAQGAAGRGRRRAELRQAGGDAARDAGRDRRPVRQVVS